MGYFTMMISLLILLAGITNQDVPLKYLGGFTPLKPEKIAELMQLNPAPFEQEFDRIWGGRYYAYYQVLTEEEIIEFDQRKSYEEYVLFAERFETVEGYCLKYQETYNIILPKKNSPIDDWYTRFGGADIWSVDGQVFYIGRPGDGRKCKDINSWIGIGDTQMKVDAYEYAYKSVIEQLPYLTHDLCEAFNADNDINCDNIKGINLRERHMKRIFPGATLGFEENSFCVVFNHTPLERFTDHRLCFTRDLKLISWYTEYGRPTY